ncbi:MAG: transporter ATP-binding protein [Ilumatobacteraceae bacterium]|nr:transporter ATP-binding protein [Ilumatobacteraceae bacterium]
MASITLESIDKIYDNGWQAIFGLSLDVADGEFLVLVGPSGCGKSTALRMIAGLESISGGTVSIDGKVVNDLEAKDRDIAMVFQSYALYPHLTVRDNISFALKLRKMPKAEIEKRVNDAARLLELTEVLDRRPAKLSGGQRQRVAMGRAIVRQPKAFLMDEPLSNLDAKLRVQMRGDIAKLQRDLEVTTVYVTHDQVEAMTMGDRVAVLNRGVLMQVDTPQNLYDSPANLFVAAFIGSPQMNLLRGTVVANDTGAAVMVGDHRLNLSAAALAASPGLLAYGDKEIAIGVRPEDVSDVPQADGDSTNVIRGEMAVREGLGNEVVAHLHCDMPTVNVVVEKDDDRVIDQSVFVARLNPRTPLKVGDTATLYVDTSRMHFFDLETSNAIR